MSIAIASVVEAGLEEARILLRAGRTGRAVGALRALAADHPDLAAVHYQLALALEASGDGAGAEAEFRAVLTLDSHATAAATSLAARLNGRGQFSEAADLLRPLASDAAADTHLLTVLGAALKGLRRMDEAASAYARAAALAPESGVAQHNLAGAYGDAQRFAESDAAVRRAFDRGLDAPETWLVHARALQGLDDFDAAEDAFRQAARRRPAYADALGELAQLIWMRTGDAAQALEPLDAALRAHPWDAALSVAKATLLDYAGDKGAAYEVIADAIARQGAAVTLQICAVGLIAATDPQLALMHADTAYNLAPESGPAITSLCHANLAAGRADVASAIAADLRSGWPLDQYPIALAATAWRLLDDPRYRELYDYERLVRAWTLETPPGWSSLTAYLDDLTVRLRALHQFRAHPVGQSVRGGTQTVQALERRDDPVIKALFGILDGPIREYIATLKRDSVVLGARASQAYRFAGAWSAQLQPHGHHVNHLHQMGWISSACHIALPTAVDNGQDGWLTFGEPGVVTTPRLGPEHFVKPKAGGLVLFPSYMWHGTVPFAGETPRLSVAFDVLPA
jgi:tetratricopeptide (TPR) repeat protein